MLVSFAVSFVILAALFRNREVGWKIPITIAGVMLVLAFVFTFPPVFEAFAPE
jgi:hypothetical protein